MYTVHVFITSHEGGTRPLPSVILWPVKEETLLRGRSTRIGMPASALYILDLKGKVRKFLVSYFSEDFARLLKKVILINAHIQLAL